MKWKCLNAAYCVCTLRSSLKNHHRWLSEGDCFLGKFCTSQNEYQKVTLQTTWDANGLAAVSGRDKPGDKRLLGGVFLEEPHHFARSIDWPGFFRQALLGAHQQGKTRRLRFSWGSGKNLSLFPLAHEKERCASARALSIFAIVKARREQVGQTTDLYEG